MNWEIINSKSCRSFVIVFGILVCCFYVPSCSDDASMINESDARNQILQLHELQRTFHFEKRVDEFVELLSPDHISVNRGEVESASKEEHLNRFTNYFNSVEFLKWDDITPPIIKFSNDYSLAYTIVDKEVVVEYDDDNGNKQKESTKFAWVAIYKRYGDEWKIDCVSSTNQPSEILQE